MLCGSIICKRALEITKEIEALRLELTKEIGRQSAKTAAIITGYITLIAAMFKFFGA